MKLLTKEILKKLPAIGTESKVAQVKFFHPMSNWTWYLSELDPITGEAFGLVVGHEAELGYFNINELQSINISGLGIERDLYWDARPLSECEGS